MAVSVYVIAVLSVGYAARRARRDSSLSEFYLAGRSLSGPVLLLTLYATQYSGNTLLGYPGEAYRLGFAWVMSIGFMMSIIVVYLLFAPRLHRLATRFNYITPGDWFAHRFQSPLLTNLANLLLIAAIASYLLAQLMAMGHITTALSGSAVPYWVGVVMFTLVIIVYETVGGMRAVAWTDCIQGLLLVVGLAGLLLVAIPTAEELGAVTQWIAARQPEKVGVPSWPMCRQWVSTVLLIGCSGAVYPQAIQRIYAARDVGSLKRSLSVMVFLPLLTTGTVFIVGILAIQQFSGLSGVAADQVMPQLLTQWATRSLWTYAMAILVIVAVVGAIMSTADSVLLSLSSILSKDILGKTLLQGTSERRLTQAGKLLSWVVMTLLVAIALVPRLTLWGLTEIKMEVLAQVSPLFILGVTWRRLTASAASIGLVAGTTAYLALQAAGISELWGFHAGLVGLGLNLLLCIVLSCIPKSPGRHLRSATPPAA